MNFREYQHAAATTAIYPDLLQHVRDALIAKGHSSTELLVEEISAAIIYNTKVFNPYYPTLGLVGEAGELANKIKKVMRDDKGIIPNEKKLEFIKELGDVLWYVAALATELEIDLDEVAETNIKKLFSRKDRGKLGGSGDDR